MSAITDYQAKSIVNYLRRHGLLMDDYTDEQYMTDIRIVLEVNQTLPPLEVNVEHDATPENIERIPRMDNYQHVSKDVVMFYADGSWEGGRFMFDADSWYIPDFGNVEGKVSHFMIPALVKED